MLSIDSATCLFSPSAHPLAEAIFVLRPEISTHVFEYDIVVQYWDLRFADGLDWVQRLPILGCKGHGTCNFGSVRDHGPHIRIREGTLRVHETYKSIRRRASGVPCEEKIERMLGCGLRAGRQLLFPCIPM